MSIAFGVFVHDPAGLVLQELPLPEPRSDGITAAMLHQLLPRAFKASFLPVGGCLLWRYHTFARLNADDVLSVEDDGHIHVYLTASSIVLRLLDDNRTVVVGLGSVNFFEPGPVLATLQSAVSARFPCMQKVQWWTTMVAGGAREKLTNAYFTAMLAVCICHGRATAEACQLIAAMDDDATRYLENAAISFTLPQGCPDWFASRGSCILTASDARSIKNKDAFARRWLASGNASHTSKISDLHFEFGHRYEPVARDLCVAHLRTLGLSVTPWTCGAYCTSS